MTEPPPLRLVDTTLNDADINKTAPQTEPMRNALALSSLDRVALTLIGFLLLLAPVMAGLFASPSLSVIAPQDAVSWLQILSGPIVSIVTALALGVMVAREWQKPVAIGMVGGLAGGACVMAIWALVSLAAHPPLNAMKLDTWVMLLAVLTVGGLVSRLGRDRNALFALILVIVAAGSLAAGWGINEYLDQWKRGNSAHRAFGTFLNPDFLAGYLLLTLPLTLACFVSARERMTRLLVGLGLALQTACLLLTGSRAGVAMLFVAVLAWLLLVLKVGAAQGRGRQLLAGLGLMLVSALLASTPLFIRLTNTGKQTVGGAISVSSVGEAADTQAHSGKFRQVTWAATLRMAHANLLTGTGIGTYENAFPRYAIAAPTAHAHNSYLQWTAETGVPGAICLLILFGSSTAFAAYVLILNAPRKSQKKTSETANESVDLYIDDFGLPKEEKGKGIKEKVNPNAEHRTPNTEYPLLLLTGLLAAIMCSLLHSLFDSDWYILANALTLSAIVGLLVAQARDIAPLATQKPRPLSKGMLAACGVVTLLLLIRGGMTYLSRFETAQAMLAEIEFQEQSAQNPRAARLALQNAVESYQSAADTDGFASEPLSHIATLFQRMKEPERAQKALEQAARITPSGLTYYRLGKFSREQASRRAAESGSTLPGDMLAFGGESVTAQPAAYQPALDAFLRARACDPHNLQTLRALAETYALSGNLAQAVQTYQEMTDLETSPVGTIRAMPEATETEYAYAHARLGKWLLDQEKAGEASARLQQAAALLRTYWQHRGYEMYQLERIQRPDKAKALNTLYDLVLTQWQKALQVQGATANGEKAKVEAEQATFHQEQKADEDAAQKAAQENTAAPAQSTP